MTVAQRRGSSTLRKPRQNLTNTKWLKDQHAYIRTCVSLRYDALVQNHHRPARVTKRGICNLPDTGKEAAGANEVSSSDQHLLIHDTQESWLRRFATSTS